ncbi:hypothetical protein LZC95_00610 [Pendulispora brunnea]|uniref:Uncharacterized protein n=1 Tax=Pendulispora brunnea TaxID=2905690 RepID=A0ABZ2K9H1_9BACT
MSKLPRVNVMDKQIAVAVEEERKNGESLGPEALEAVNGGRLSWGWALPMYGVGLIFKMKNWRRRH